MPFVKIPFNNGVYKNIDGQELDVFNAKLYDGYINEHGSIVKRPGLTEFCDLGETVKIDGLYWWSNKGVVIAVCNGKIFKISDSSGTNTDITGDTLETGTNVVFATDGTYVVMANGGRMISYNNTGSTSYIGDADAPTTVSHIAFLDRYLIANNSSGSGMFYWSNIGDLTSWSALSFATAGGKPDDINALNVGWRELALFGKESVEIWFNDGNTPFRIMDGAFIDRGNIATYSPIYADNTIFWLDNTRRIVKLEGRAPKVISTPYDKEIQSFSTVSDCTTFNIEISGKNFLLFNFPTEERTIVYDYILNKWYEWTYYRTTVAKHENFLGQHYCYASNWNKHLIGDRTTGVVYELSTDEYTDNSDKIRTVIQTGHINYGTYNYKRSKKVTLKFKAGVGNSTVSEPKIMLRWKDDNKNWSNEIQSSIKKQGDYDFLVTFYRLGIYRTRQWEIIHSDQSQFILIDMEEEVEILNK